MNNLPWEAIAAIFIAIFSLLIAAVKREVSLYTKVTQSTIDIKDLHSAFDRMQSQFQELSRNMNTQQVAIAGMEASLKSIGKQLDRIYRTGVDGD